MSPQPGSHKHKWYELSRSLEGPLRILWACSVQHCIETKVEAR